MRDEMKRQGGWRRAAPFFALAGALALGGCYDDGYGYGGVYAGGGYYSGYNDFYDGSYGGGYPPYGWNDGFYYPGSGIYIYDRGGRRHEWHGDRGGHGGPPPGGWRGQGHSGAAARVMPGGWHGYGSGSAGVPPAGGTVSAPAHHFDGAYGHFGGPSGSHSRGR